MPYKYLDDIATADVAFEAWARTLEKMFVAATDATMNVMVGRLSLISDRARRPFEVTAKTVDLLLFQLLQEQIFFKDAEQLLLRVPIVHIEEENDQFTLKAEAYGERLDPEKHQLGVDVKAVTLHRFRVHKTPRGWEALVILDV